MGLSDDQRAMLRLLAQREQGYEDIAALMGLSVDEVRARVGEALAQLEEEGKEPPPVPAPEPPAPPQPAPEPPAAPVAPPVPAAAKEPPAPEPEPPAPQPAPLPPAPSRSSPGAGAESPPPNSSASAPPKLSLPADPARRAALAAGLVVVALLVVVLIVSGGGGDSSTTSAAAGTEGETAATENTTASNSSARQVTKAVLEPVGGSGATGVAIFGRVKNSLALQLEAEGLEPTAKGVSYTVWLAQSPQKMLPLASTAVPKTGRIAKQFEVPVELLAYLASETFDQLVITHTSSAKLKAALKKATEEEKVPTYTGTTVLSGTVTGPIVGAAKRQKKE